MITGEQKPVNEIREMIAPYKRILVLGCGSCVAECAAGGEKETAMLASALRMAARMNNEDVVIEEMTLDRQCVNQFVIQLDKVIDPYDAVVSLGCGAGCSGGGGNVSGGADYSRAQHGVSGGDPRPRVFGRKPVWDAAIACSMISAASARWPGAPSRS